MATIPFKDTVNCVFRGDGEHSDRVAIEWVARYGLGSVQEQWDKKPGNTVTTGLQGVIAQGCCYSMSFSLKSVCHSP